MTAVGTRVFAVRDANNDEINLYGFGVYAGDFRRPTSDADVAEMRLLAADAIARSDAGPLDVTTWYDRLVEKGEMTRADADQQLAEGAARAEAERARPLDERVEELVDRLLANPRIDLDDGGVVWGCECWWNAESKFDAFAGGRTINRVEPPT